MLRERIYFLAVVCVIFAASAAAPAQTTEFTYQGRLIDGSLPATGTYDFEFRLFDVDAGGTALGNLQRPGVAVSNGAFTVKLDFGAAFDGTARWLEIAVKPAGSPNPFTTLAPRNSINSAPYAIRSLSAQAADTAGNAAQLGGVSASQYVITNDPRMSDARDPLPNSASYVQNSNTQQAASNFNIDGNGTVGGTLAANAVTAATQYNIGISRVLKISPASIHLGPLAGESHVSGSGNSYFGDRSGRFGVNVGNNSFFGRSAGELNTASDNSFFGAFAGDSNTTGTRNSFFGRTAGDANATGNDNSFFGYEAGRFSTGSFNSIFGSNAGDSSTTAEDNSFFGYDAGTANTTGSDNSFFGSRAGRSTTTSGDNSFFGAGSGAANTTGTRNSYFGGRAGSAALGNDNSFFGFQAGTSYNGSSSSFFGANAGAFNDGLFGNSFFGTRAGQLGLSDEDSFFGYEAGQHSRHGKNSFFGYRSGANTGNFLGTIEADFNSFFGHNSGLSNTTGASNTYIGAISGTQVTDGSFNVFVGASTGLLGSAPATASWNTLLGFSANVSHDNSEFRTAIGAHSIVSTDHTIVLGKTAGIHGGASRPADRVIVRGNLILETLAPGAGGTTDVCRNILDQLSTCSSSLRYKTEIRAFTGGLDIVRRLRPITYDWKESGIGDIGFGAEEVAAIEPLLTTYNKNGEIEGVKYGQITTVLVNAIKEQQAQIEAQQRQLDEQKKLLKQQQRQIDALKQMICLQDPQAEFCVGEGS